MRLDLVEYFWDERDGVAEFIYEDDRTGETETRYSARPMPKPEVTPELQASYFANLSFWLRTQPLYD